MILLDVEVKIPPEPSSISNYSMMQKESLTWLSFGFEGKQEPPQALIIMVHFLSLQILYVLSVLFVK